MFCLLGAILVEGLDAAVIPVSRIRLRCRKVFFMLFELVSHGRQNIHSVKTGAFEMLYCPLLVTADLK